MKRYTHTALEKRHKLKPLVRYDFGLIKGPLDGVFTNIDRDLERRAQQAARSGNEELRRQITLLSAFIRIASNSYAALCFLQSDLDEHAKRRPNFVLVAPPVNRQLLDLLFSLVYIRDDFEPRSLAYERASWRAFKERHEKLHSRFGHLREWRRYFTEQKQVLNMMALALNISKSERSNLRNIGRWKGPFKLSKEKTASQPFLQWMEKWIYDDVSAEAHLTGIGLFMISPFILANRVEGEIQELIESRAIHQYRAHHFGHTLMVVLAIATEIDSQFNLGNHTRIAYIWRILSDWSADAKDMFQNRYEAMLANDGR